MERNCSFIPTWGRGLSLLAQLNVWWFQTFSLWPIFPEEWCKWKWVHSAPGCKRTAERAHCSWAVTGPSPALCKILNHRWEACCAQLSICSFVWPWGMTWITDTRPRFTFCTWPIGIGRCRAYTELADLQGHQKFSWLHDPKRHQRGADNILLETSQRATLTKNILDKPLPIITVSFWSLPNCRYYNNGQGKGLSKSLSDITVSFKTNLQQLDPSRTFTNTF